MISLIIISGRSGSGKSTALHVLEDMGYYCIDNLPASLLPALLEKIVTDQTMDKISVSVDARNISPDLKNFPKILEKIDPDSVSCRIIYLDSISTTLAKRFSETRRKHPLSDQQRGLREAIDFERQLLEPISEIADLYIDTTSLTIHELRDLIRERIAKQDFEFALLFESFAYKHGVPLDADLVFDARCLPNPHWKPELRELTGKDQPVQDFLESQTEFKAMFSDICSLLETWLPKYEANNRSYMTIAIGCTGGQHRSVYFCEKLHATFKKKWNNVRIKHREQPGLTGYQQEPGSDGSPDC